MGYKAGEGLGKRGQGMSDILDTKMRRGRRGLGFEIEGFDEVETPWVEDEVRICHIILKYGLNYNGNLCNNN